MVILYVRVIVLPFQDIVLLKQFKNPICIVYLFAFFFAINTIATYIWFNINFIVFNINRDWWLWVIKRSLACIHLNDVIHIVIVFSFRFSFNIIYIKHLNYSLILILYL